MCFQQDRWIPNPCSRTSAALSLVTSSTTRRGSCIKNQPQSSNAARKSHARSARCCAQLAIGSISASERPTHNEIPTWRYPSPRMLPLLPFYNMFVNTIICHIPPPPGLPPACLPTDIHSLLVNKSSSSSSPLRFCFGFFSPRADVTQGCILIHHPPPPPPPLRVSVLCLPTDIHSLLVNKPPPASSSSCHRAALRNPQGGGRERSLS